MDGAMRVGIIGAGRIGLGLAELLTDAGIDVIVGSRNPSDARFTETPWHVGTVAAAMREPVMVLSVPHAAITSLMIAAPPSIDAVVIDTANAVDTTQPNRLRSAIAEPHGRWLQRLAPQARVARAFTHVQDELLVSRARRQPDLWAVAVAADDPEALSTASRLVHAARYIPVSVGQLDDSAVLDPGGILFPNMFLPDDMRTLAAGSPARGADARP